MVCFLRQGRTELPRRRLSFFYLGRAGENTSMGSYYWLKGRVCEVSGRRSPTTFCAKGRGTKSIHTAWRAEMTEDVEKTEEEKVQRNIFGTFGSYILQQKPPFSAHGRSLQHTEIKAVLPKRQCIYHSFTAGYTHVHPRTQPCHRSLQADPTAHSQASCIPNSRSFPLQASILISKAHNSS